MSKKPTILLSGRDPGSAGHILELCRAFRSDGRFEVRLYASGAALTMLSQAGETPMPFTLKDGRDHIEDRDDPTELIDRANILLSEVQPDAVLVSLSSYGAGIDEALLATCRVPSFAMQDFWGDVNLTLGTPAGLYFVLDEFARQLSAERWGVSSMPVGSPKHRQYAEQDIVSMGRRVRASICVEDSQPLVGFFGQAPSIPGHEESYLHLVEAAAGLDHQPAFLIREHPKFRESQAQHRAQAEGLGLQVIDVTGLDSAESWLAACNVVTTPFSSCALDHAYLSAYSCQPIGTAIYVMSNEQIRSSFLAYSGMTQFPTVDQGIGSIARTVDEISALLQLGINGEGTEDYFKASKALQLAEDPCRLIMDAVGDRILV